MKELLFSRAHTVKFSVEGGDLARFLNRLSASGVTVVKAERRGNKTILILPAADIKNLFAICDKMCYNIIWDKSKPPANMRKNRITLTKIREGGYLYPLIAAARRPGVILGSVAFISLCLWFDGLIIGFKTDVPPECKSGVMHSLYDGGARVGVRFKDIDEDVLSKKIVEDNPSIAFATVKKEGSFLSVQTVKASPQTQISAKEDLLSPMNGKIVKISVLRGTQLVEKGDEVKKGDVLVGAYYIAGEERVKTSPVYEIIMQGEYSLTLSLSASGDAERRAAIALVKEKCPFSHIIGVSVVENSADNKYLLTVILTYQTVLGG